MSNTPWILIAIIFALLILGLVFFLVSRGKKNHRPPDYYALFIMGIIWLPLGIPLKNYGLSAMGFIFMIAGLVHKDKWKENRVNWKSLSKEERALKLIIVAILGLLVLAGVGAFILVERGIINF